MHSHIHRDNEWKGEEKKEEEKTLNFVLKFGAVSKSIGKVILNALVSELQIAIFWEIELC